MHLWSRLGNPNFNRWWVMVWRSSKWGQFWVWSYIWPWRSKSITPQNNRDLNQGVLHLWFKFGDSNLNEWKVIARTSPWLTPTRTDAGNDNTRRPKLASGKKPYVIRYRSFKNFVDEYFIRDLYHLLESFNSDISDDINTCFNKAFRERQHPSAPRSVNE